jgi:hypothetical protein
MKAAIKKFFKRIYYRTKRISWYGIKGMFIRFWQRRTRGWDDSELWNLDYTFTKYILPRLKRFRAVELEAEYAGVPQDLENPRVEPDEFGNEIPYYFTIEEWKERIDKMILAFELMLADDDGVEDFSMEKWEEKHNKVNEGLRLFALYYQHLWS